MGTNLLPKIWEHLIHEQDIVVWLDPDDAGRNAAADVASKLQLVGETCRDVVTEREPKYHSKAQIADVLAELERGNPFRGGQA